MIKKLLTLSFLLILCLTSYAQKGQKANYELAARFSPKKVGKMVFSTTVSPKWFKNSDKFWYTYQTNQGTFYYVVDPVAGTKRPIFDNATLAAQLTEIVKDPFDAQNIPIQKLKLVDEKSSLLRLKALLKLTLKMKKQANQKKRRRYMASNTIWLAEL